jgi:dipeptidyl-peptidase 4
MDNVWLRIAGILLLGWGPGGLGPQASAQEHSVASVHERSEGDEEKAPSRIPPTAKLRIRWTEGGAFWYTVPNTQAGTDFVWVDPRTRQTHRAASREELESKAGVPLSATTGKLRIEPSETLGDARIEAQIRNDSGGQVQLFWIDFEGRPQPYGTLAAGESRTQSTFMGHTWVATNSDRKPIWTGQASGTKEVLSIQEVDVEPFPALSRGGRNRRRNDSPSADAGNAIDAPWKVERESYNLRFQSPDGGLLDTSSIPECAGTEDCRYDRELFWSPNRRFAFTLQTQQGEHREVTLVESSPRDQLQPRLKTIRYDKPGDRIDQSIPRLFDLEQGLSVPLDTSLFANPWSINEVRWSDDSTRLTFVYNQRGHQVMRLIAIDAATGAVTSLIEEASPTYIDYAAKAYREYLDESEEILWGSERSGWYHLYRFHAKTGELLNACTQGNWVVRSIERIDREKRQIWFYAGGIHPDQDPYYRHLCRVNFDGSDLVVLTQGEGDHQCQFSPDQQWLIATYSRVDLPPVHELRSAVTGERIMELERSEEKDLWPGTSRPERFVAKGRDGTTDIFGILVRPTHMEPGKRYPIIENIYAGPQDSFVPKAYSALSEYHALAELGFVVVKIDGMGTSNRSKAFHDVSYRNLSDGGFPDRKLWMQAAANHFPEMDIGRVGIYGGSAGGQNALAALLFHGDFYDAAVADCGCHDNRMDKIWWNELYMGWPVEDHYEASSNVANAHRLTGKLMLVVGELDTNVDPSSTMQVVDALIRSDKDFDLILVPGAGHGIGSSPYCKRRRDAFFIQHLQEPSGVH